MICLESIERVVTFVNYIRHHICVISVLHNQAIVAYASGYAFAADLMIA